MFTAMASLEADQAEPKLPPGSLRPCTLREADHSSTSHCQAPFVRALPLLCGYPTAYLGTKAEIDVIRPLLRDSFHNHCPFS